MIGHDASAEGKASAATPLSRFSCTGCGYGASAKMAPEQCPMCGGSTWEFQDWRPFRRGGSDRELRMGLIRTPEKTSLPSDA
jgi:hypothetical protein